jgi:CotH protein.
MLPEFSSTFLNFIMNKLFALLVFFAVSLLLLNGCSFLDDSGNDDPQIAAVDSFKVAKIFINTENAASVSSKDNYLNCSIEIQSETKQWNYSGKGSIRGRGNSSWLWYPKKPYRIKLNEESGILGLKSDKDWVLLADYRDPTHLMSTFALTVGKGFGLRYTNHVRYVEVTLNGDYIGMYILTEQVEQGKNRVAIDSTDGALISLDADDGPELSPSSTDNFWSSVYRVPVCVKSPELTGSTQLSTIKNTFAQLETAIKNGNYDVVSGQLDIQSFIDFMIIQELVYNVEVDAPRSMYMFKDKGGRWTMGPLWDFDAGFDFDWSTMYTGHNYFTSYKELVLGTDPVNHTGGYYVPAFFTDLFRNKQFVSEYKARWIAIKDKIMSEYWPIAQQYADRFAEAQSRDAARWPIDKNNKVEILKMKQWLTNRVGYLSTVIANYPVGTK